jgi:P22 coat protein - gene protein 5
MANTLLSPTIITREALRILHQKSVFIGTINRQYDDRFANSGASPSGKIGPTLQIRLPNLFSVRTGTTMQVQDITESSVALTVSTVKGVDFTFPTVDLTLTIDDFAGRYLKPAMMRLAADIEADALSMYKDVANFVDGDATALSPLMFLQAGQKLDESLAPGDGRIALMCPTHSTKLVDALKGQYNPQVDISQDFREGEIARRTLGFDFMKTTLLTSHQTGTAVATTLYTVNGATESGSAITVQTGTTTFLKGDLVTFVGCNKVHPETKADLGYLHQFVITANSGASATSLAISPAIVVSGPGQNVTGYPTNTGAVVKLGVATVASATLIQSLLYYPDAFTFVSADLEDVSKYGAWGARERLENISMRIARQYDITNDKVPCRIDVLYGYKTVRPSQACRLHADG